jgi:HEAT repeats
MGDWERQRQERHAAYQRDAAPVIAALTDAGIDPTDFGRFVNRPVPGVLEPSHFDHVRALPILLQWLPRIANEHVKESIVRHLRTKAAKPVAAEALLTEFHRAQGPNYKWVIADVLQYVCDKRHYPQIMELATDRRHGIGRAPLVGMLWRVKTAQADDLLVEALSDPDVARVAMSALRRRIGNAPARPLIEPLINHPHEHVRQAAADYLRRIDKSLTKSKNKP